jgi:hypothetical protein
MRNKLFFAFLAVVLTALISNLLYEYFISRDFEDYVGGTKEDKLYWVLASVEGSYEGGRWDQMALHNAIHWAIMLGFDVARTLKRIDKFRDDNRMLSPSMKRRMKGIDDIKTLTSNLDISPLFRRQ